MSENEAHDAPVEMANSLQTLTENVTSQAQVSQTDTLMHSLRSYNVTLNRMLLTRLFIEHGVLQVIIDAPVDDAFRGGIDIKCAELDADDIRVLQECIDTEGILTTLAQACKWARLYGGGGVIPNFGQKFDKPLDFARIKQGGPLAFYAVDRWELSTTTDGNILDQTTDHLSDVPYNYYGIRLHKTNLLRIDGRPAPSMVRAQFQGWGVSELERLVRDFNQYLKHTDVVFELLDEAKLDIFGVQNYNSALASPKGTEILTQRIQLAARLKSHQNALVMDVNDKYDQKQITFAGLSDMLNEIRKGLAADARFPLTKLFGLSASGFNSGDDDIENYNAMVETDVRSKVRGSVITLLKCACQHCFGFVPDTLNFEWRPLRILNHKDESELKSQSLNRVIAAQQNGLLTSEAAAEQLNASKVFTVELNPKETLDLEELRETTGGDMGAVVPGQGQGMKVLV